MPRHRLGSGLPNLPGCRLESGKTGPERPRREGIGTTGRWGVAAGVSEAVIATKLFKPDPRRQTVQWERLHDLLRQGSMLPLTLIVAPAGWGKSTLVADWLA